MRYVLVLALLAITSCSWRATYPAIGGGIGGGLGSLAGPGGSIAGGLAGAGIGTAMMEQGEHAELKETICEVLEEVDALTSGDVQKLIELKAKEQQSWFDKVVDGIYNLLIITAIGAVLIIVVPILYTKFHIKKLKNGK